MTGHSRREERLVHTLIQDTLRLRSLPMITNGPPPDAPHECVLYFDGAAQPNPGFGGCGWHLQDDRGREMARGCTAIRAGSADVTSNEAEYEGLIRGLGAALEEHARRVLVCGDSELVLHHMTGEYECRHPRLAPLRARAKQLAAQLHAVRFQHVPRARNATADALAADALARSRAAAARWGSPEEPRHFTGFAVCVVSPSSSSSASSASYGDGGSCGGGSCGGGGGAYTRRVRQRR